MPQNERRYQKTVSAIGGALLIFLGLTNVTGFFSEFVFLYLSFFPFGETVRNVTVELVSGAGYLLSFMLPAGFLRLFLKHNGCGSRPMAAKPNITPELPFLIFAGIAISFSAAEINAALVSVFDYSSFSSEVLWNTGTNFSPYEIVLNFITVSIIPGFCEEFLFRGAILENCLPFGKANAVFISAFLFSMMHQNSEQILYTFVAGIVLGLVYVYTGSIWNCTVLHICNNFVSVIETAAIDKLGATASGSLTVILFEGGIYLLGIISVAVLILRHTTTERTFRDGIFGKDLPVSFAYAECPVPAARMRKLFLQPTMVVFLVLSVIQILFLLLMAVFL